MNINVNRVKIIVTVPSDNIEEVRDALFAMVPVLSVITLTVHQQLNLSALLNLLFLYLMKVSFLIIKNKNSI